MDIKTMIKPEHAILFGLAGKIIWDWLSKGRMQEGVKQDVLALKIKQKEIEKRLDDGQVTFLILSNEIKELVGDISKLREEIAGMHPLIKTIAKNIILK